MTTPEDTEHAAKKARIKAAKDKLYASKTIEKGLLIVHTGTGKGKSTAAWGLAMRCLGHGLKLGVVQFVKGRRETGERQLLERFPELVTIKVMGEGFTWETQDKKRDIEAAEAAWGLAMRCLGHGLKLGVVQFVKGRRETGERQLLERFPELVTIKVMGEGFTWETQDKKRDIEAAEAAWAETERLLQDPELHMLILDELNIVLRYDYLPLDRVLDALRGKRPDLHVVVTGRNAKPELIEAADLVTEMTLVKHPFRQGVKGQLGVEW